MSQSAGSPDAAVFDVLSGTGPRQLTHSTSCRMHHAPSWEPEREAALPPKSRSVVLVEQFYLVSVVHENLADSSHLLSYVICIGSNLCDENGSRDQCCSPRQLSNKPGLGPQVVGIRSKSLMLGAFTSRTRLLYCKTL